MFDLRTDDLGESGKEMGTRSRELIATDESTVLAKSSFYPLVVEDGESDRCFPNSPCTNKSDGFKSFGKFNNLLNKVITSETVPGCWGR